MIYPRCHFYSFYTKIDLSENFATEPSKVDLLRFLDDFDVSDIKNFEKDDVDKLKFAIMFEMTRNKVNALNLKDDLILKYKLDKNEREILNTIFSEVQDELLDLVRHRK